MYVNHRKLHHIVQVTLDLACMPLIWRGAIETRILLNRVATAHVSPGGALAWAPSLVCIVPLWLALLFVLRLYRRPERLWFGSILKWALENAILVTTAAAIVTFFSRQFGELTSRMFVPAMLPVSLAGFLLARYAGLGIAAWSCEYFGRPMRVALLGDGQKAAQVMERIRNTDATVVRGLIVPEHAHAHTGSGPVPVLGTTRQIADVVNREQLEHVIVLNSSVPDVELERCIQVLERMGVSQSCAVEVASGSARLDLTIAYGLPFVEVVPEQFTRRQELAKRMFDVAISAGSLLALTPLLVVIAVAIRMTSDGPILYKSRRVGKGGRHFTFLKFRSMYVNNDRVRLQGANEKDGHIFKMKNDPRVTPVGRWLRRYSLDELPQLWNVLLGEMSLVGPRPLPASDLEPDGMSRKFAVWSEGRAQVQPGLTGLWQISGRSDLSFEEMVRLDLSYIQNWSLALDIRIILNTPLLVLRGVGAY